MVNVLSTAKRATAQVAVHFFQYNFCWLHMTLKGKTPCQATGVAARRWSIEEMLQLLPDAKEAN
jgi:hypothetical protein